MVATDRRSPPTRPIITECQEKYFYNANFFLNKIKDRRGNDTNFNIESVVGNITRRTNPDTTFIDYVYTDTLNHIHLEGNRRKRQTNDLHA